MNLYKIATIAKIDGYTIYYPTPISQITKIYER